MSKNVKIQVFMDFRTYSYVLQYQHNHELKTESQAIYQIVRERLEQDSMSKDATDRLNKVIQGYANRIKELEFELKTKNIKESKIINKKEVK